MLVMSFLRSALGGTAAPRSAGTGGQDSDEAWYRRLSLGHTVGEAGRPVIFVHRSRFSRSSSRSRARDSCSGEAAWPDPDPHDAGCAQIAVTADPQEPVPSAVCVQS
jgi:hypothetical protein